MFISARKYKKDEMVSDYSDSFRPELNLMEKHVVVPHKRLNV